MHILWLPSWFPTKQKPFNGIFFLEQAQALFDANLCVRVIYPDIRPLREFSFFNLKESHFQYETCSQENLDIFYFKGWNLFPKFIKKQKDAFINKSLKLFENYRKKYGLPDLLHAQSAIWGGLAAKVISDKYAVPFVVTEHLNVFLDKIALSPIDSCWTTPLIKEMFLKAKGVLSVSNALNEALKTHYNQESHKFMVMPNCVDTDFFKPSFKKSELQFKWISISHLVELKNIFFLLRGFTKLVSLHPRTTLSIYGDGPLKKELQKEITRLNLASHVELLGFGSREEIKNALSTSHAFVLPSQVESFGIVYIEAMASGLPVVATNNGGANDIVLNSNGYLVNPTNEEDLVQSMLHCQANWKSFDPIAISQDVKTRFSKETFVEKHRQFYKRSLNKLD